MLTVRTDLPDNFLYGSAGGLHQILPGPTLFHLPGRRIEPLFVSVLLHGNEDTGLNPHYACVNRLDAPFLHLATLFSRIVVVFKRPLGVQSAAFAHLCPAVTVECGKPGVQKSEAHAVAFFEAALHLEHLPGHPVPRHDIDLYHTIGIVKVPEESSFTFGEGDAAIRFEKDLDHMNFRDLPAGTRFGRVASNYTAPLQVMDEDGREVFERYFEVRNGELRTRRAVMPAMLTLNERAIRQDCLCYLMERLASAG